MAMNRFFTFLFCIALSTIGFAKNNVDSLLRELDKTVENSQSYTTQKETKLSKLREKLTRSSSLERRYILYLHLYNENQSYKYDSAYTYAGRMLQLAEKLNNSDKVAESKMALAFSCVSAGLFKEATEISNSIDTTRS